jgi:hypothetical protein
MICLDAHAFYVNFSYGIFMYDQENFRLMSCLNPASLTLNHAEFRPHANKHTIYTRYK